MKMSFFASAYTRGDQGRVHARQYPYGNEQSSNYGHPGGWSSIGINSSKGSDRNAGREKDAD